mgnify:CR=1 FL=1|tara:strand:+ start:584 stop:931 length:348 start_codon:yes stop_codon:yes gene_type:complete
MKGYKVTFDNDMKDLNAPIPYKDGEMSIQASEFHYCYPKDDEGPYTQVEVAVFDKDGERTRENMLKDWADDPEYDKPIYAYVPYGRVVELLKSDGYTDENIYGIFKRLEGKNNLK